MQPSYRIAIVGAGPAGFYAAEYLLSKAEKVVELDIFDRLPTPYGLVRAGVAPDHAKIKNVTKRYSKTLADERVRFFGNVDIGDDVSIKEMEAFYHAIVFTTGAQIDKRLGIEGEDLESSHSATEFVAWYNGHPDYSDHVFDLSGSVAVVVGVGNVAVDVARILCRSIDELKQTDIADYALAALAKSNITDVHMLGRRGPAEAAFTNPEIKELGELIDADIVIDEDDARVDELSRSVIEDDRLAQKKTEIISNLAAKALTGKPKRLHIHFLTSPTKIVGEDGRVAEVETVKNELFKDDSGRIRPRPTKTTGSIPAQLIFRSVGYRGVQVGDLPFNESWGTIPHEVGRVIEGDVPLTGKYVAGWIKRGPSGVIGTNKADAIETAQSLLSDLDAGLLDRDVRSDISEILGKKPSRVITYEDWCKIDEMERARGAEQGRPRVKFTSYSEFEEALSGATKPS